MSYDRLGGIMFLGALVFILTGYPVAFALGGTALALLPLGIHLGLFDISWMQALPQRIFNIMENYILLAVPPFIFMGTMLERSGLAEDLLKTMGQVFGPLRGGLALSVVVVGTLLATTTGVVGATVVAMGLISPPIMLCYGILQGAFYGDYHCVWNPGEGHSSKRGAYSAGRPARCTRR